jgi:hypothetical protein
MADRILTATDHPKLPSEEVHFAGSRLATILHVQWALAIACAYLVLFGRESGDEHGLGPLVVAGFLATNLVLGRLRPALAERPLFGVALGGVDAALIVASLYVAGQLSIELVLLCVGILVLAVAGLSIGAIALATLALTGIYLAVVWFTGGASLWRSSVLLRVPLLFTAAVVYAWLVELGSRSAAAHAEEGTAASADTLLEEVAAQWDSIERCRTALRAGAVGDAEAALQHIATQNQAIRMCAGALR